MLGKSGGKTPITRHPLFPATVALWFGALFGLGSLAISASLIERAIVALAIDAAIPAATPPLGATTRILIALTMALIGGMLGAWLARRMGRPAPVTVTRRRGAANIETAVDGSDGGFAAASRRSRLALNDEGAPAREYLDRAPVPGAASILDVSQFDLDGFEDRQDPPEADPEPVFTEEPEWAAPQTSAAPELEFERIPQGAQVFQPDPELISVCAPDADDSEDRKEPVSAEPADSERVSFVADETGDLPDAADSERVTFIHEETGDLPNPADVAQPSEVRAEFLPAVEAQDDMHRHGLAIEATHDAEPSSVAPLPRLGAAEAQDFEPMPPKARPGSVFDRPAAPGLFTRPHNAQVSRLAWDSGALQGADPSARDDTPAQTPPQSCEPAQAPVPEPADATAMERIASAHLDTLSPVELLERLALSMRRKREAAAASVPRDIPETTVSELSAEEPSLLDAPGEAITTPQVPPIPTIPAALRPIGLDEDDEADLLPVSVPPRRFAQPQAYEVTDAVPGQYEPAAGPDAAPPATVIADAVDETTPEAEAEVPETSPEEQLEEGYSSLLSLSRPGSGIQRFVRVEEPEKASGEIEPVVVFPAHEARTGEAPFSHPASERTAPAGGQADAASPARRDAEETDRALRTALANIQRMTGAA